MLAITRTSKCRLLYLTRRLPNNCGFLGITRVGCHLRRRTIERGGVMGLSVLMGCSPCRPIISGCQKWRLIAEHIQRVRSQLYLRRKCLYHTLVPGCSACLSSVPPCTPLHMVGVHGPRPQAQPISRALLWLRT